MTGFTCGPFLTAQNERAQPGDLECREFIWSSGHGCKRCHLESCFRKGMTQRQADAHHRAQFRARKRGVKPLS